MLYSRAQADTSKDHMLARLLSVSEIFASAIFYSYYTFGLVRLASQLANCLGGASGACKTFDPLSVVRKMDMEMEMEKQRKKQAKESLN